MYRFGNGDMVALEDILKTPNFLPGQFLIRWLSKNSKVIEVLPLQGHLETFIHTFNPEEDKAYWNFQLYGYDTGIESKPLSQICGRLNWAASAALGVVGMTLKGYFRELQKRLGEQAAVVVQFRQHDAPVELLPTRLWIPERNPRDADTDQQWFLFDHGLSDEANKMHLAILSVALILYPLYPNEGDEQLMWIAIMKIIGWFGFWNYHGTLEHYRAREMLDAFEKHLIPRMHEFMDVQPAMQAIHFLTHPHLRRKIVRAVRDALGSIQTDDPNFLYDPVTLALRRAA
jgi:hypothetical protein